MGNKIEKTNVQQIIPPINANIKASPQRTQPASVFTTSIAEPKTQSKESINLENTNIQTRQNTEAKNIKTTQEAVKFIESINSGLEKAGISKNDLLFDLHKKYILALHNHKLGIAKPEELSQIRNDILNHFLDEALYDLTETHDKAFYTKLFNKMENFEKFTIDTMLRSVPASQKDSFLSLEFFKNKNTYSGMLKTIEKHPEFQKLNSNDKKLIKELANKNLKNNLENYIKNRMTNKNILIKQQNLLT